MHKPLMLSCSLLLTGQEAFAQTGWVGVTAGATISTLVGPGTSIPPVISPLAGIVVGVYHTWPLRTKKSALTLQPELLYSQQGYRLTNAPTNYEARLRLHYVCLPVRLVFTYRGFFAAGGPQGGYLVGVSERYTFQAPAGGGLQTHVNTDPSGRSRWDGAVVFGVGYCWPNGLGVEGRYTGSVNGIYPDKGASPRANPRNATLQIHVSYSLLKK